ncbi:unnamed protein product, partial [Linum tenue]
LSTDQLSPFSEECFFNSLEGYLNDKTAVLELHKASQIIFPEEPILEELNSYSGCDTSCPNIGNKDFLELAAEDFSLCQSIQQKELDKLSFARQKLGYCYFSAATILYAPELSDARISWAKNGVLITVVDDFFDVGGSMEEFVNLIQLLEKYVTFHYVFHT